MTAGWFDMTRSTEPAGRTALITGISGQDGSYLADLLIARGYTVHGTLRPSGSEPSNLAHLRPGGEAASDRLVLHDLDPSDTDAVRRLLVRTAPDEFYHLAGQSHVGLSFEMPEATCDFTAMGTLRILEVLRDLDRPIRFLNIASSEIFGRADHAPQTERTPFRPTSPYGVARAFAFQMVQVYRETFGIHASSAICYNHESPRRGPNFVTRKITRGVADIVRGKADTLPLGNLDVERDWGYAPEYVEAMHRIVRHERADDFVLATGRSCSLRSFIETAFGVAGLDWRDHVTTDPRFVRPAEPTRLLGDPSKAREVLGWSAEIAGTEVARLMMEAELGKGAPRRGAGRIEPGLATLERSADA